MALVDAAAEPDATEINKEVASADLVASSFDPPRERTHNAGSLATRKRHLLVCGECADTPRRQWFTASSQVRAGRGLLTVGFLNRASQVRILPGAPASQGSFAPLTCAFL